MATSVTSYVDVVDDRNAPSPKYFTAPNTWQALVAMREKQSYDAEVNFGMNQSLGSSYPWRAFGSKASFTFNQPVKMSESETNAYGMFGKFSWSQNFDLGIPSPLAPSQNLIMNNSVDYTPFVLFNSEVIISTNVTNCCVMFDSCASYNQPTHIPNKVTDCRFMFNNCWTYNQPTIIPNNVKDCSWMFSSCLTFNQPIVISNNVTKCDYMFAYCPSMNSNVVIGDNVQNCRSMFRGYQYGSKPKMNIANLIIPKNVNDCSEMFMDCGGRPANIFINNGGHNMNFYLMLMNTPNARRTNIYCSDLDYMQYVNWFGSGTISWSSMINGYYNSAYNIYLYRNYNG